MEIADKVENLVTGDVGTLLGDGILSDNYYVRTHKDLVRVSENELYTYWVVVQKCDTTKPVRAICMFS